MKKRKQITCPQGETFAEDWNDISECKTCRYKAECKAAHNAKSKTKPKEKRKQDNRGLYIPRPALDKLLKLTYQSCTRLYCFYMREAARQKTNRPWCNNYYTAKRLKCGISTVVTGKNLLRKAGFIKIVSGKSEHGHFSKHYIELRYYPSKFVIENQEYKRRLDKYAEQLAEWANVFTSEKMKLEIEIMELKKENKKLRRKCRKSKRYK